MRLAALALILLAAWTPAAADTDVRLAARRDQRLALRNLSGQVQIVAWAENAIRVVAEHEPGVEVRVVPRGRTFFVEAVVVEGRHDDIDYRVSVPAWMPVHVEGVNSPVFVEGLDDELLVETVNGSVQADRMRGRMQLSSVNGAVRVRGAKGRVRASSINQDVALENIEGDVFGEAVNGDIVLRTVTGDTIYTSTVQGDVEFAGTFRPRGRYRFATHAGDLRIYLPRETDADVESYIFAGDLVTPMRVLEEGRTRRLRSGPAGKRFEFQLGAGGALLELESFEGDIELDWLENSRIR